MLLVRAILTLYCTHYFIARRQIRCCQLVTLRNRGLSIVQKRFTKRLPNISHLGYTERLKATGLDSLELRRLHCDLLCTYKVLFGKLEMDYADMFVIRSVITVGYQGPLVEIVPKTLSYNCS